MTSYTVTVGPNAQSFHDASTGITVCKNETVTLRNNQYTSPRIRQALASGHLVLVQDTQIKTFDVEKYNKKIRSQYSKGIALEKIASNLNLEQAKELAKLNAVEVEDTDTVIDILKVLLEED